MESVHSPPVFPLAIPITVGHETTSRTTFELGHLNNNQELENIKTIKLTKRITSTSSCPITNCLRFLLQLWHSKAGQKQALDVIFELAILG